MSGLTDHIREFNCPIYNIKDLANLITEGMWDKNRDIENQIKNALYAHTECGMWITCDDVGFEIGSIVEGSSAEFSKSFFYPVNSNKLAEAIDEIELQVDQCFRSLN